MKRVLLLSILLPVLLLAKLDDIPFRDLARLASQDLGRSIVVPDSIKDFTVSVDLEHHQNRGDIYSLFRDVLSLHGLKLEKKGRFMYVVPVEASSDMKLYKYCFRGVTADDASLLMQVYDKMSFKYLPMTDCIAYRADHDMGLEIRSALRSVDQSLRSKVVKITIYAVNQDKLHSTGFFTDGLELGFDSFVDQYFGQNALGTVYQIHAYANFKAVMKYLTDHGVSEIIQSPTMLLTNGIPSQFKAVKTVPYVTSTASIKTDTQSTTESVQYKDVGLQLKILPKIKHGYVYLKLDLISEELLSINGDRPITQKIEYQNSVILRPGLPVLLTGFKKVDRKRKTQDNILSRIPFIGSVFRGRERTEQHMTINVLIELLPSRHSKRKKARSANHKKGFTPKKMILGAVNPSARICRSRGGHKFTLAKRCEFIAPEAAWELLHVPPACGGSRNEDGFSRNACVERNPIVMQGYYDVFSHDVLSPYRRIATNRPQVVGDWSNPRIATSSHGLRAMVLSRFYVWLDQVVGDWSNPRIATSSHGLVKPFSHSSGSSVTL